MLRVICLIVGYVCGLMQTGYLFAKAKNMDIREHGSGNSGATNALRVLGFKAGLIVFLGDFLKALLPCMALRWFYGAEDSSIELYVLYMGLGVVLGHSYPFYLNFKGGKGVASTAGILAALDIRIMLICLVVFALVVLVSRYVSLASISVMVAFVISLAVFLYRGMIIVATQDVIETISVCAVISALSIYRHRQNIVRLLTGTENKLGKKAAGR